MSTGQLALFCGYSTADTVKPRSDCVHDSVCMTAQCHTLCCDTLIIMISRLNAPPICDETIQAMYAQVVRLVLCESIILYVGIYIYPMHCCCVRLVRGNWVARSMSGKSAIELR